MFLECIHGAVANVSGIAEATREVFINPSLRYLAFDEPRCQFETVLAGKWCPWVITQISDFFLKSLHVSNRFSGAWIASRFTRGRRRRDNIRLYHMRLGRNLIQCVGFVTPMIQVSFIVGIRLFLLVGLFVMGQ